MRLDVAVKAANKLYAIERADRFEEELYNIETDDDDELFNIIKDAGRQVTEYRKRLEKEIEEL